MKNLRLGLTLGLSLLVIGGCEKAAPPAPRTVMFFGDSLTAGFGLQPGESYPALLEARMKEKGWTVSVVNAGVSGDTTAGGLRRLDQALADAGPVDVFVLALGANDILRRMDRDQMEKNLSTILERAQAANPRVKLVVAGIDFGWALGVVTGVNPIARFERVAKKHDAVLIPNLLRDVINQPQLNQPDGLHPNAEGAKVVAENAWAELKDLMVLR